MDLPWPCCMTRDWDVGDSDFRSVFTYQPCWYSSSFSLLNQIYPSCNTSPTKTQALWWLLRTDSGYGKPLSFGLDAKLYCSSWQTLAVIQALAVTSSKFLLFADFVFIFSIPRATKTLAMTCCIITWNMATTPASKLQNSSAKGEKMIANHTQVFVFFLAWENID